MAVSSRAESEEAGEAVSGAWTAYFLAAAAYRTTAAATGNGGARSFDQVRHSGDNRRNRQPHWLWISTWPYWVRAGLKPTRAPCASCAPSVLGRQPIAIHGDHGSALGGRR